MAGRYGTPVYSSRIPSTGRCYILGSHCATWPTFSNSHCAFGCATLAWVYILSSHRPSSICNYGTCSCSPWFSTLLWSWSRTLSSLSQWFSLVTGLASSYWSRRLHSGCPSADAFSWPWRTFGASFQSGWWAIQVATHRSCRHSPSTWRLCTGGFYSARTLSNSQGLCGDRPLLDLHGVVDVHRNFLSSQAPLQERGASPSVRSQSRVPPIQAQQNTAHKRTPMAFDSLTSAASFTALPW